MMQRIIYHVISRDDSGRHCRQLRQSLRSLRRYDWSTPVYVFCCAGVSQETHDVTVFNGGTVIELPPYEQFLRQFSRHPLVDKGDGLPFPTLGKLLALVDLRLPRAEQMLYLDTDTFWLDHPDRLFERYADHDFYASPEVGSRAFSSQDYDPAYLDEDALLALQASERLAPIKPFNSGAMLINGRLRDPIVSRYRTFLSYVSRFIDGELPFPAPSNLWLIDQMAALMLLAGIRNISIGHFEADHVRISNQFTIPTVDQMLAHYFTANSEAFVEQFGLVNDIRIPPRPSPPGSGGSLQIT